MKQTKMLPKEAIRKRWLIIDANNQILGRLASRISRFLLGKHKPFYTPHNDCGDYVVVINSQYLVLTGNKWTDKKYYYHTQYPHGLKVNTAEQIHTKDATKLLRLAVKRMLPKNRLARQQIKHLFIYSHRTHQHSAQKPLKVEF